MNWQNIIGTLISGGLLAGGFQFVLGLMRRGNNKADAAAVVAQAAGQLAEDVAEQLDSARKEREAERREREGERVRDRKKIYELEEELRGLRGDRLADAARIRELEEELRTVRSRVRDLEKLNEEKDATIVRLRASNGHPFG